MIQVFSGRKAFIYSSLSTAIYETIDGNRRLFSYISKRFFAVKSVNRGMKSIQKDIRMCYHKVIPLEVKAEINLKAKSMKIYICDIIHKKCSK